MRIYDRQGLSPTFGCAKENHRPVCEKEIDDTKIGKDKTKPIKYDLRILIVTIFFAKFNNNSPENRFWIPFKKFFLSSFPIPIMWIDHRLERSKLYLLRKSAMFRVWCVYLRRKLGTATRELWIPLKLFPTPRYCNIAENGTAGCILSSSYAVENLGIN